MRDLQEEIWAELRAAVEAFQKAFEENTDLVLITELADKVKELESRLRSLESHIAGVFLPFRHRPDAIVRMHLAETPQYV